MKIYALVITVTPNDKQDSITAALTSNIDQMISYKLS